MISIVPANNALEFIHFTNLSKQFILFYNSKLGNELGVAQLVSLWWDLLPEFTSSILHKCFYFLNLSYNLMVLLYFLCGRQSCLLVMRTSLVF
jgi:hypothetical protein